MRSLNDLQQHIEQWLTENKLQRHPISLYEPIHYLLALGGKRIRPLLVAVGCEMFANDQLALARPIALAVEYFHNFSLMHDDIMDNAHQRRGKATVHTRYNLNTAILSGDAMLVHSYRFLETLPSQLLLQVLPIFTQTAIEVCEGQQWDMQFEQQNNVSTEQYIDMITGKTAVLLAAALQMGALAGGASFADSQHLYEFGKKIGIAFQLQDDILDTFGDAERFGKKIGGDIIQNKKTFLLLQALQVAEESKRQELEQWLQNHQQPNEKIVAVTQIYRQLNVLEAAEAALQQHHAQAFEHLDQIKLPDSNKANLLAVVQQLEQRSH